MKKSIIALMLLATLAVPASASEPGLDDAFFLENGTPIFVSKCHFTRQEADPSHRFYLIISGEHGYIIRDRGVGFAGLAEMFFEDGAWGMDYASNTTATMASELRHRFMDGDFVIIKSGDFSLANLAEVTENCDA